MTLKTDNTQTTTYNNNYGNRVGLNNLSFDS